MVFPFKVLHRRGFRRGERGRRGRYKKLFFHASLDKICIFILANTPHHCPQIIYTDLHVASDGSRTPGCYFGPLAAGLTAFLKSYHLLSCAAQTPRQKQEKHWVDTKAEFIFSLREADISHCTALAPAHLVLSDCAPQKTRFDSCSASIVTYLWKYPTLIA